MATTTDSLYISSKPGDFPSSICCPVDIISCTFCSDYIEALCFQRAFSEDLLSPVKMGYRRSSVEESN